MEIPTDVSDPPAAADGAEGNGGKGDQNGRDDSGEHEQEGFGAYANSYLSTWAFGIYAAVLAFVAIVVLSTAILTFSGFFESTTVSWSWGWPLALLGVAGCGFAFFKGRVGLGITMLAVTVLVGLGIWGDIFPRTSTTWNWGWFLLFGELLFLFLPLPNRRGGLSASFWIVNPTDIGTKTVFGKPVQRLTYGPYFAPRVFCPVYIDPRSRIQLDTGTPVTDKAGKEVEMKLPGYGTVLLMRTGEPQRVTFSATKDTDDKDPLSGRLTGDPHVITIFQIRDHARFLVTYGSLQNALLQVEQHVVTALQERCAKYTPAYVLDHLSEISEAILGRVEWFVGEIGATRPESIPAHKPQPRWSGIDVLDVQVKTIGLPKRVNEAIADLKRAGYERDSRIQVADALKAETQKRLEGQAEGEKAILIARAHGWQESVNSIGAGATMLSDVSSKARDAIVGSGATILLPGDLSKFAEAAAAAVATMEKLGGIPIKTSPTSATNAQGAPGATPPTQQSGS